MSISTVAFRVLLPVCFVFIAIFLAKSHRELDWEVDVLPMARQYSIARQNQEVSQSDLPLTGVVAMVTGSTSGIGLSLTRALSRLGAEVIAFGRSPTKLASLKEEIPTVRTATADFEDLESVAESAKRILEDNDITHLDILINNAGIHDGLDIKKMLGLSNEPSPQGFDRVFTVNYLSHFLLTEKMIPLLQKSADARVVQVSSSYHWGVDGSDLLPGPHGESPIASRPGGSHGLVLFRSQRSYANSKLAQIYHARAFKRYHPDLTNIRLISICPAWVGTSIAGQPGSLTHGLVNAIAYDSSGWGIASSLHGIFSDPSSGDFFTNTDFFDFFETLYGSLPTWSYAVGLRDIITFPIAMSAMVGQKFFTNVRPNKSSQPSYNDSWANALYEWSYKTIEHYL